MVILLLAAVLRLGWPGLTEFKADEAHLYSLALDMAQGRAFPVRGLSSSVGLPNFPMSVWLYALPLTLWPHVYSATLFTGLLNTLAVAGGWWFTRRYWGSQAALVAALLYAVSPWAVAHSRKIWAQNLLAPFVVAWAITAGLAFVERRPRYLALHLLCLAVAAQIHLAAVALVPATFLWLAVFRRRVQGRPFVAGLTLAALTLLPFAWYIGRQTAAPTAAIATPLKGQLDLLAFRYTWLLTSGREIHALAGPAAYQDYLATVPDLTLVHVLWSLLAASGLLALALHASRFTFHASRFTLHASRPTLHVSRFTFHASRPTSEASFLVLIWAMAPPLFFTWHVTPIFLHYLLPVYPALYVAAGALASPPPIRQRSAAPGRGRGGWVMAWLTLAATAAAQVWVWGGLLVFLSRRATPGGFGAPLALLLQATDQAQTMLAETQASEILIAGPGESPDLDEWAAVQDALLRSLPHRFVNANQAAVFPATAAVALVSPQVTADLYRAVATHTVHVPLRQGEGIVEVLALPGRAAPPPSVPLETPALFANQIRLIGYDGPLPMGDGTALWRLYWQTGAPATADYHFFNHLLNAQGQRVSQADGPAFAAGQWRPGDLVISHFRLPWPADRDAPLTMRVGLYTYPDLTNVPRLDAAGNPASDAAEIELE